MVYNPIYIGGSYEVFAFIKATYPSGNQCICTDGNRTFYAEDTSGYYAFGVPYAAVWYVSCPGTTYATKSVSASVEGHSYSATIS